MGVLDRLRKTFSGLTDKYLDAALAGTDVLDVTGTFYTDHYRDYTRVRLQRYQTMWRFYRGEQFQRATTEGKRKLVINLCRPIVNKSVDWLFGHGFKITAPPGNDSVIPILDLVWDANNRNMLMWEHGQMGSVTGDAFLYISVEDRDPLTGKPMPIDSQRVVIHNLNSAYVHPVYDPTDMREMQACLIQFPTSLTYDPIQKQRSTGQRALGLYSIVITRAEVVEYWNRTEIPDSRRANFLGRVPVVHTRNIPIATSFFGQSDIEDITALNENLNEIGDDIDSIVKYHAAPLTVIFGARAQQLEVGANRVWSGLPKDARVENVKLEGQLDAAQKHWENLKLAIHELSNTPEGSLGKIQEISNTSGAALEMQYMPLIEKTRRKYFTYGGTIVQANEIILQILDQRFGINIDEAVADKARSFETGVDFISPLPMDKKLQVDLLTAKLNGGLESQAGALRELGVPDVKRKMLEIMADKRAQLAEDTERAVASAGLRTPNLGVFTLGSFGINLPELAATFDEQDEALLQHMEEAGAVKSKHEQATATAAAKLQLETEVASAKIQRQFSPKQQQQGGRNNNPKGGNQSSKK